MIDSHFHADTFAAEGRVDELLDHAREAGVERMIAIGGGDAENALAAELAAAHPGRVFATAGYDRGLVGEGDVPAPPLDPLRQALSREGVVGVGETGLDYHYGAETALQQQALFQSNLQLAAEFGKPVVVHSRDADDDTLGLLREFAAAWPGEADRIGVLHCFTRDLDFARAMVNLGLYISFSGILTFKTAESLREVAKALPLDRILVETDAPYLAPVPHRGKTNEPAWVVHVVDCLAETRGEDREQVRAQTTANAERLFGLV